MITSTPTVDPLAFRQFYEQKIDWKRCKQNNRVKAFERDRFHPKRFQCADIIVPLDYDDPGGRHLTIAVNRLEATGERVGSLLTNPGGPGASGLDYVFYGAKELGASVRKSYDIIGFDPRGVGESNGIRCMDDAQLDRFYLTDTTPDTPWETMRLRSKSKKYAAECQDKAGWLLPHVGTASVARDMDLIRTVLGDKKLNYLGFSYGTQLGQVYADLFPGRTRRMVLDSVVDSALWAGAVWDYKLTSLTKEFDAFLDSCVRRGCPLGSSRAAARSRIWKLLGATDRKRIPAGDAFLSDTDIHQALVAIAMDPKIWATARDAFSAAVNRDDGRLLASIADASRGRAANGEYDSSIAANLAVRCLETTAEARKRQVDDKVIDRAGDKTLLHAYQNTDLACSFWAPAPIAQHPVRPKDTGPVLLLNNTRDPRTPLGWAEAVTARLPDAVLVTNAADGHIAYGRGPCVNKIVDDYLVSGRLPAKGAKCSDPGRDY